MRKKKSAIATIILLAVLSVLTFALAGCNPSDKYNAEKIAKRDAYALLTAKAEKGQFVMIGDSIVELYKPEYLADSRLKVYNRGISGDTSYQMYDRLASNALDCAPSVVFILAGTNDLSYGKSVDFIADSIMKSVDKCLASGVNKVLVGSILPVNKGINSDLVGKRKNSDIKEINARLVSACTQNEKTVFVDLYSAVVDGDGNFNAELTYDGLHPNGKGYCELTKVLSAKI